MKLNKLFFIIAIIASPCFAMDKSWIGSYLESEARIKIIRAQKATDELKKLLKETNNNDTNNEAARLILLKKIDGLITDGANPAIQYENNYNFTSIFCFAAEKGNFNIISFLIGSVTDQDTKDSALYWAACEGHIEIVEFLFNNGATPRIIGDQTALMKTAQKGHLNIAKLLIKKGEYVNARVPFEGRTALMFAVENGHADMVKLLLENKADPNIRKEIMDRNTPLMEAADRGHTTIVDLLLKAGAKPNKQSYKNRYTALAIAVKRNYQGIISCLLEHGADPNIPHYGRKTPLMIAAEEGIMATVELLIQHKADIYYQDKYNRTALSYAACKGDSSIVFLLIKTAKKSIPPLESERAIKTSYFSLLPREITQLALSYFDYVNCIDHQGNSPLILAFQYPACASVVRLLLENGANVNIKNNEGKTALDIARVKGTGEIIQLLTNAAAKQQSPEKTP